MSDLYLDIGVKVYGGAHIPRVIRQMVGLANRLEISIWADLNGVRTLARPGDNHEAIYEAWDAAITHKHSHASAEVAP